MCPTECKYFIRYVSCPIALLQSHLHFCMDLFQIWLGLVNPASQLHLHKQGIINLPKAGRGHATLHMLVCIYRVDTHWMPVKLYQGTKVTKVLLFMKYLASDVFNA